MSLRDLKRKVEEYLNPDPDKVSADLDRKIAQEAKWTEIEEKRAKLASLKKKQSKLKKENDPFKIDLGF